MGVIAFLLGCIFLALVWPKAVRWVMGALVGLIILALAYALTVAVLVWSDLPQGEALRFAAIGWGVWFAWGACMFVYGKCIENQEARDDS